MSIAQFTISLRRPIFSTMTLLRRASRPYSNGLAMLNAIPNGVPSMPTIQPEPIASHGRLSPIGEGKPALDEASGGRFAFSVQYNGQRRSTELPFSQNMIGKIALEAQFRDMQMCQLLGELITATVNKDLFQVVLGEEIDALSELQVKGIKIFPD
jgi:hypothetical protein